MFLGAEYLPVKCTNSVRIMILLRVFADGCLDTSKECSLRGRRSKGKGKEIRARDHARQNSPFPFPFERLPRRLKEMLSRMLDIIHLESNKLGSC